MGIVDAVGLAALPAQPRDAQRIAQRIELLDRAAGDGPAVAVLVWPDDYVDAERLRHIGEPRLLVLDAQAPPPDLGDALEDWVRPESPTSDVRVRIGRLRRAAVIGAPRPWLDGAGRLLYRDRWVAVSDIQERLAEVLVERFKQVVGEAELLAAGWPTGARRSNTLSNRLTGLRARVATVGLELVAIRGAGYLLQPRSPERTVTA